MLWRNSSKKKRKKEPEKVFQKYNDDVKKADEVLATKGNLQEKWNINELKCVLCPMKQNSDPKMSIEKEKLLIMYRQWTQEKRTRQPALLPQPQSKNDVSEQHNEDDDVLCNEVICNDDNDEWDELNYVWFIDVMWCEFASKISIMKISWKCVKDSLCINLGTYSI